MPEIDPGIMCHHLAFKLDFNLTQKNSKEGEDKRIVISKEINKLKDVVFIREIRYPT